jgi:glycosyltransferase involved in cell wall biosynthesis
MKTLYVISKGLGKPPTEEIKRLEEADQEPRATLLEEAISADVLDERYLANCVPTWRSQLYSLMPVQIAQIMEIFFVHKNYDAVFIHNEKVSLPMALLIKYSRMKTPYVITVSRITSKDERKTKIKKWLLNHTQDRIDKIFMWSAVQHSLVVNEMELPAGKVKRVRLGTDQEFWRPMDEPDVMICSVGMEMRDYPTLVEALNGTDIPCHFAVGRARGELFDTVKDLYAIDEMPRNITVGKLNRRELRKLYARSRFLVISLLPTDSDNGQTAILEAMAMGKPVICSDVEGQAGLIEHGKTGLLVPQGDPMALRESIQYLWNRPDLCVEMGWRARRFVEENHSIDQFVNAIRAGITDVVTNSKRASEQTYSGELQADPN